MSLLLCCCHWTIGWGLSMCGGAVPAKYPLPHCSFALYDADDDSEIATCDWNPDETNNNVAGCKFKLERTGRYYCICTPDEGYHLLPVTSNVLTVTEIGQYSFNSNSAWSFANSLEAGYYCYNYPCCPLSEQCDGVCPPWKLPPNFAPPGLPANFPNPLYVSDGLGDDVELTRTNPYSYWTGSATRKAAKGYETCPDWNTCFPDNCDPGDNVEVTAYYTLVCIGDASSWFLSIALGGCPLSGCIAGYPYVSAPGVSGCYSGGGGCEIVVTQCGSFTASGGFGPPNPGDPPYAIYQIYPNGANVTIHE